MTVINDIIQQDDNGDLVAEKYYIVVTGLHGTGDNLKIFTNLAAVVDTKSTAKRIAGNIRGREDFKEAKKRYPILQVNIVPQYASAS